MLPSAMMTNATYALGELFAGAGGTALGADMAATGLDHRFAHAWANDIDADACETFRSNIDIRPDAVVCGPIQDLDFGRLAPIDGLVFGFPCNDFSVVGERNGIQGHYGGLYAWAVQALRHFRPSFFIAENVGGMASTGNRNDLHVILAAMEQAGYDVFRRKYRFEDYGVPQARHRIILTGFRKDLRIAFEHPRPLEIRITCRQALEDPPIPSDAPNNQRARQHPRVVERLRHIKPGENAFTADLPPHLRLNMRSRATISLIYRRLDPNRPSYTVTGSGGGGTHVYHWDEPRALTNRERARLQSFPDDFAFRGSRESVRRQIGMAVPPVGAKHIFRAVLKTLIDNGVRSLC